MFGANTSAGQSINSAEQEKISIDNNKEKGLQAFYVAAFHAIMDVISAANKAMAR